MTVLVTPVNSYGATLSIPADGESVNSASVLAYIQEVANRLEFLRQRVPGANPSANLIELVPEMDDARLFADWTLSLSTPTGGGGQLRTVLQNGSSDSTHMFSLPLDKFLRSGMIVRVISCDFVGVGSHAALPATMPKLQFFKIPRNIGATALSFATGLSMTLIDSQTDTSANTAAYQLVHTISKTLGVPETIDLSNFSYILGMSGEYGANALTGSFALRASISVSA